MEAYQFYRCDSKRCNHLLGVLPERRKDPARITQQSIMNWGKEYFALECGLKDVFFIQVTIDPQTGRIHRPKRKIRFYKIFYKNYELKRSELLGVFTERRKDFRGKTQIEAGTRWARLKFGDVVKDTQAIFIVPDELDLSEPRKTFKQ